MKILLLVLLCASSLICASSLNCAEPKPAKGAAAKPKEEAAHTEPFVGKSGTFPLMLKGKAAGNLDLKFGATALESKWLAAQGFAKVPYTVTKVANGQTYTTYQISVNVTTDKGPQLILSLTVTADVSVEGNLSTISKADGVKNYIYTGKLEGK